MSEEPFIGPMPEPAMFIAINAPGVSGTFKVQAEYFNELLVWLSEHLFKPDLP